MICQQRLSIKQMSANMPGGSSLSKYLMKLDAFTQSSAIPAWQLLRAAQNQQQPVVSVFFCITVAAILWRVTLPVGSHPDL